MPNDYTRIRVFCVKGLWWATLGGINLTPGSPDLAAVMDYLAHFRTRGAWTHDKRNIIWMDRRVGEIIWRGTERPPDMDNRSWNTWAKIIVKELNDYRG